MMKTPSKRWTLTTTFVGLVCGLVLTQNKLYADTVSTTPDQTPIAAVQKSTEPQPVALATQAKKDNNVQPATPVTNANSAVAGNTQTSQPATQESQTSTTAADQPAVTDQKPNTATQQPGTGSSTSEAKPVATDQPVTPNSVKTTNSTTSDKTTTQSQQPAAQAATDPTQNNETLITNGQSGTAKWDYVKNNTTGEYILKIHAGQLNYNQISNWIFKYNNYILERQLNKIIIDPNVYAPQNASYLFSNLKSLKTIEGLANLQVQYTRNMAYMFANDPLLDDIDLSFWPTYRVTDMGYMFYNDKSLTHLNLDYLDTGNVLYMRFMFYGTGLTDVDLSTLDLSRVQDMSYMFANSQLQKIDLSFLDLSNVTNMAYAFSNTNLTSCIMKNLITPNVKNLAGLFFNDVYLTNLDLSNLQTSNVTNMNSMFAQCENLQNINVSGWDTNNVTDMGFMFSDCKNLRTLDLSNFNTSKVTTVQQMFMGDTKLTSLDIRNFDLTNANGTDMLYATRFLNRLVLGAKTFIANARLTDVPRVGFKVPGTNYRVNSSNWVAVNGPQTGQKFTSKQLMDSNNRVAGATIYQWDTRVS